MSIGTYIVHKVGVNKYKHILRSNFTRDVLAHFSNGLPDHAFIQFRFDLRHAGIDELFVGLECCCVLGGSVVILEGREGERRKLGEEGQRKGRI